MSDSDDDLDSNLPYGSHPVSLSRKSQELLECVANWNVSVFEPLKFVPAADVKVKMERVLFQTSTFTRQIKYPCQKMLRFYPTKIFYVPNCCVRK